MEDKLRIQNPIVFERADPWVYLHTDGYYYFTGSVPGYQGIEVRRSRSINDLENAEKVLVWHAHDTGPMSRLIWAPEIHFLDGKWYIYFAASDDEDLRNRHHHHRMFVIENANANPFEGSWQEKGQLKTQFESFSLDGTVFTLKDKLYYVWAQQDPNIPGNSNLYISEMASPWTLKGKQTLISMPTEPWEKIGFKVNEGPAAIIRNGKVFITYSGSATDENYAMGLLWADESSDLLDGFSWHKELKPVFVSSERHHQFGPGHNSFTTGPNGEDILIYHARPEKNQEGDPLSNPNRHAIAQQFDWNEAGFPVFGEPVENTRELEVKN
ncbi:family 43 glycosylhydrolase [Enterococcus sp. HY326]|uniref:glycoside hydrolase family 43 protein n=1 Tax=Enterococcus sp. HY326 TaxID=2971265 RepID=UPI00223FCEB8|nr:family 43 glycosylhydrolase [Enterococcus sp. HY326]